MSGGVLVVTGGASGIGLACAKAMAVAHDRVALIDLNEDGLATAAAEIGEVGGSVVTFVCDVASSDAMLTLAARIERGRSGENPGALRWNSSKRFDSSRYGFGRIRAGLGR